MIKIYVKNKLVDKEFGAGLPDELEVRIGGALHHALLHYNDFLRWHESKNVGQSQMEPGWQPHAENITELTARDYKSYYKGQGYEVRIVPSKRYTGKFDMYLKRR